MALTGHHELGGRELGKAHRAAGMELLGADADLRTEAELLAVDETGRGIHQDGGRIDAAGELLRCGEVFRSRWLRCGRFHAG